MRTIITTTCIAALAFNTPLAYANPVGGSVVGGRGATITGQGTASTTINQTANKVIINWQDFSIGAGEITRFIQPSSTAAALNRVVSGNPSLIYGSLQANGRVFVINPNGILVGPSGQIDTKAFIASTMNVRNADFLSKENLIFSGDSAAGIRNEGSIQALGGDVFLIAHTVDNAGTINAPQGTVGLAAGSQVQLMQAGNERISVLAGNSSAPADKGVNNSGTIAAASAELKAAGGNIYALAINNGGVVRADGIVKRNGHIYLGATGGNIDNSGTLSAHNADGSGGTIRVEGGHNADAPATVINSGTIEARGDAAGTQGGEVRLLGDHVGLNNNALVDVSGDAGGGVALIGGDYHGGNSAVQNAERTFVGPDARVRADAITQGNGGKVVVWSDDVTRFYGGISSRGGALGGNGGFVEVSGHNSLIYRGQVDLQSPVGFMGTLLLDPKFIIIATGGPDSVAGNDDFAENTGGTSTISPVNLVAALNSANVTLRANTDITVSDVVDASAGAANDLILRAGRSIIDNANITVAGGFDATFNDSGATTANRDPGAAVFTMGVGRTITAPGGISIQGGTLAADSSGATTISANTGDISIQNLNSRGLPVGASTAGKTGGAISVVNNAAAGKNITIGGTVDSRGSDAVGGGNHAGGNGGLVTLDASGILSINAINTSAGIGVGTGNGGDAGNVLATGTGGITLNNNVTSLGGTGSPAGSDGNQTYNNLVTLGNDATLNGGVITFSSTINGARNLVVTGSGAPVFGAAIGGTTPLSSFTVNSAAAFTFNRDVTAGSVSLASGTDGTGSLDFGVGVDISADTQSYRAGDGLGGGAAATVDLSGNTPNFRDSAGSAAPVNFTYRQDAAIADTDIPSAARFGGTPPTTYTIQSDEGTITLSTASKVANSALTLIAADALAINASLTLASIQAQSGSDGTGNLTFGASAAVNANSQSYQAGDGVAGGGTAANVNLTGNTPDFRDTAGAAAPGSFTYRQDAAIADTDIPAASQFGGTQPAAYTIRSDDGGVQLPALTLPGTLQVIANGNITQSGALDVSSGSSTFTINTAANADVLLGQANHFAGQTVTINSINLGSVRDVTLRNVDATAVGATFPVVLRNLTVRFDAAPVTLPSLTLSGDLDVTANGLISDSGNLSITGTTTLAAGSGNDITLNNGNDFVGAVSVTSGRNVALVDVNSLTLDASTISGNLGVTASGLISDIGNLTVNGTTALAAGSGNDITLDNANDFVGAVAIASGRNVTLNDVNALTLAASTVSGNLDVTANGLISDIGNLTVNGTTALAAGSGNDITLVNANDFVGAVSIGSGRNVTLNDVNALTLGASTISGNLNATANGLISDSGNLTVNGTTTLAAGVGNDITLNNANNFVGAVTVTSGRNVTLNDVNALTLAASTISGNLDVTANGVISQSGSLTVSGTTTLAAGSGNDITLNSANDFAGAVSITSGRNVTLVDVNAILLGASTVSGTLGVTASGNISQNGALTVTGGASTFTIDTALGADVLLGTQPNHFGNQSVAINAINGGSVRDVSFRNVDASAIFPGLPAGLRNLTVRFDNAAVTLPTLNLSGNLDVTASGLISDSGNLTISGTTLLAAGVGNDITLNNVNDFVGAVSVTSGRNVTLNDINALTLGASTVSGILNVTANGLISDSGNLTINGTTTLAAGALNDITLDNANDFVGAVGITSGQNVTLNDVNSLVAGASTVSGNLSLSANGTVTQTGDISAAGLSVNSGGSITLDGNNNVGTLAAAVSGAGNISFTGGGSLTIGTVNALSGLKTANGTITVSADSLQISQAIDSGAARTTLNSKTAGQAISLGTETPGALSFTDAELDLVTAAVLQIGSATAGSIDVNGAVSPANTGVLTLINNGPVNENAAGSISVNNLRVSSVGPVDLVGANDVNTLAIASSGAGNGITFRDTDDLTIGTVDTVNGVVANNGPVVIGAGNNLTINNTPAGSDVDAGTSTVELTAANGAIIVAAGADVHGDTKVTLNADAMTINGTVTAASTGNQNDIDLLVQPVSAGRDISLGIEDPSRLSLTQAELDKFTGNALQIGNTSVNNISGASSVVAPGGVAKMLVVSGATTIEVFNSQLAGVLAGAILPVPKIEVASFSAASISADEAAKLKVPGSISVLFLELKFPPTEDRKYKIEDISKWTAGGVAVSGETSGPQQPQ